MSIFCFAIFSFFFSQSQVRYFAGELAGSNQVPPNSSPARGTVIAAYDATTKTISLTGDYQKLSDTVTGAHIHVGPPGVNGPIIVPLTYSPPNDSTGIIFILNASYPDSVADDLLAGNMYVNVHNDSFPGGEIRTQLTPTSGTETHAFIVPLTTAQVVPKISNSDANGSAYIIADKSTGMVYVTGSFQGINSNAIQAHIHLGAVGDTGAAIVTLNIAQRAPVPHGGTYSGSTTLSAALIDSMTNGLAYIDVHSSRLTLGAMRGQLQEIILPLKLTYFNAYKKSDKIDLIWETSEELNVSRYEIEQFNITTRSWTTKGSVIASGGSSATKYSYTDAPELNGNRYAIYRLKMIDKDGKITYSSIVKVNFDKLKAELFIQTNPVVNGDLRYTITGLSTNRKAEVLIVDLNGRLLLKNTISPLMNNTLKISNLSAGTYKLIVRMEDTTLQQSFIK